MIGDEHENQVVYEAHLLGKRVLRKGKSVAQPGNFSVAYAGK